MNQWLGKRTLGKAAERKNRGKECSNVDANLSVNAYHVKISEIG